MRGNTHAPGCRRLLAAPAARRTGMPGPAPGWSRSPSSSWVACRSATSSGQAAQGVVTTPAGLLDGCLCSCKPTAAKWLPAGPWLALTWRALGCSTAQAPCKAPAAAAASAGRQRCPWSHSQESYRKAAMCRRVAGSYTHSSSLPARRGPCTQAEAYLLGERHLPALKMCRTVRRICPTSMTCARRAPDRSGAAPASACRLQCSAQG